MMPLILAAAGETNTIRKVSGNPEVKKHLEDLGFVVGERLLSFLPLVETSLST